MEKLRKSRAASFAVILAVYVFAAVVGFKVYNLLRLNWWLKLLLADAAATIAVFAFSVIFDNASVYDPYWSVQPPVLLWALAWGKNLSVYELALLSVITLWALRLTLNWAYTFKGLEHQDWRYTMLHEKTGALYPAVNLTGIHMVPTLVVYACTIPVVYALRVGGRANVYSFAALALSLGAVLLQGAADFQNHAFHARQKSGFLREGVWKYSRHPNYLGEILMWWGVALSVLSLHPKAVPLALGAIANTALFLFISVPLADAHQARKPGFEEYKSETRMLWPIRK